MGTVSPGMAPCGPTLLLRLVVDTDEVVRRRDDDVPVVDGAVWNEVDVSLRGERAAVGEIGDSVDTADDGERCDFRSVEFDAVDRTDTAERTEDTEGAKDLGRPAGGVRLEDDSLVDEEGILFDTVAEDSAAEGRGDFVTIAGRDG
jgi:hypothetical protein